MKTLTDAGRMQRPSAHLSQSGHDLAHMINFIMWHDRLYHVVLDFYMWAGPPKTSVKLKSWPNERGSDGFWGDGASVTFAVTL